MILLQAAMAAGLYMMVFLGVALVIGVPFLTISIMRSLKKSEEKAAKIQGKIVTKEKLSNKFGLMTISAIIAFITIIVIFLLLITILDHFIPSLD